MCINRVLRKPAREHRGCRGPRGLTRFGLLLAFLSLPVPGIAGQPVANTDPGGAYETGGATNRPAEQANRIVKEGMAVEFGAAPLDSDATGEKLVAGRPARLGFKITNAATGELLAGLYPAAWVDRRKGGQDDLGCKEKIARFLQGTIAFRPDVDLNSWYIVTLNEKASLSVIDPLIGYGGQRLVALVLLESPGADWALTSGADRLFVTLPETGQVAVVDTGRWQVLSNIEPGPRPVRVALQPDERYLWVGIDSNPEITDETGGVSVVDAETLKVVAHIPTGRGHHQIAFSRDNRHAFVGNELDGTVSVIDIRTLEKIKDIEAGVHLAGMAFADFAEALYAVDPDKGEIAVIDGQRHVVTARIKAAPGVTAIRFTPDGRWGFAINPGRDEVLVIDSSLNRIAHRITVGPMPDQVSFTQNYAYIRTAGSGQVTMVELNALGGVESLPVLNISGGRTAPADSPHTAIADAIVATPEDSSVLIANPLDKTVYYYMEGMAAPMGSYSNERRQPKATLVVDKSLTETGPGIYAADIKLPAGGGYDYDVAFMLDTPRVLHCFTMRVEPDPSIRTTEKRPLAMEFMTDGREIPVGEETLVRFKLADRETNQPKVGVEDLEVLAHSPGAWQKRSLARPVGAGTYEVAVSPPRPGVYFLYFRSPTLGAGYKQLPHLILHAKEGKPASDE